MAGTIARKAIDHLKSKDFRDYLMRWQQFLYHQVNFSMTYLFLSCYLFYVALKKQPVQQHSFLGSHSKLGSSYSCHHRHEEEPRDHQWQDDLRSVLLFTALHEVCLQGAATQLATVCLPFDQ